MSTSTINSARLAPIRLTRAQFGALSPYHQAVALVFLRRGTGEVELADEGDTGV